MKRQAQEAAPLPDARRLRQGPVLLGDAYVAWWHRRRAEREAEREVQGQQRAAEGEVQGQQRVAGSAPTSAVETIGPASVTHAAIPMTPAVVETVALSAPNTYAGTYCCGDCGSCSNDSHST